MSVAITLDNVTLSYARHPAVHHVSGIFTRGSLTAITGPNGAGKSTLLKAIAGLLPLDEGRITFEGADRTAIAYLPQIAQFERDFPLSVMHLVVTGFWQKAGGFSAITPKMKERAKEALAAVGLTGLEDRTLTQLSAGQFQRALFARIIVQDAPLILLDEPFTSIDNDTTTHLLAVIRDWHRQGRTVISVLHEMDRIRRHFPSCLLLARECIAWDSPQTALAPEQLEAARFFHAPESGEGEICTQAV